MTQREALDVTGAWSQESDEPLTADVAERAMSHHKRSSPMKPLHRPCHDCAVALGFYASFAEALCAMTPERREYHQSRWFCHNNPNRACAGASAAYSDRFPIIAMEGEE